MSLERMKTVKLLDQPADTKGDVWADSAFRQRPGVWGHWGWDSEALS